MIIYNRIGIFLECKAQAFVEVLANSGVRLYGTWDDCVGGLVVDAFPVGERYNGKDIVVPFDDVVVLIVGIFREDCRGRSFDLSGGDLFGEGVMSNIGTGGSFGLE